MKNCVMRREWCSSLIITSFIYLLVSIESFLLNQNICGVLLLCTFISSVLYHRYSECSKVGMVFDSLFASISGVIIVWFLILCIFVLHYNFFIYFAILFSPMTVYFNCKCGNSGSKNYVFYHNIWHIASGIGIGISIYCMYLSLPYSSSDKLFLDNPIFSIISILLALIPMFYMLNLQKSWITY